ncbi:MAG: helix-turn-helix domain-containing protein [Prevotellaceae bacterium]|jgi:AraC-like DNA-binding protein|nr:helix-turn-helix domain-containing protein [Prevotellaceae bacterium]
MKSIKHIDINVIRRFPTIDFIGNDFAIFHNVGSISLFDYPTRLNGACLALCMNGRSSIRINLREFEMEPGMLVITLPEQILQQVNYTDDFTCILIVVSERIVNEVLPTVQQLLPLFFRLKEEPCILLNAEDIVMINEYYSFLQKKAKSKDNPFRREIAQGILLALFYDVYAIYLGNEPPEKKPKTRKEELFDRFIRAVSESYKKERSVSFYADKLFLTPKHLSSAVKEVSGKTAGEWIENSVILEAKALLKSSDLSIQEIADELHFANQSFFGKYFKQHTGISPKEYRQQ